jgi:hypothetical protein
MAFHSRPSTLDFRLAPAVFLALIYAAVPAPARAENGWGLAVGLGAPLAPSDELGVTVGVSAFAEGGEDGPAAMFRFRGELLGVITPGPWAVMPTLTGDFGIDLGGFSVFIQGGVQLFGFASREDYIVFATLGLVGGLGVALEVSPRFSVGVRGTVAWLPTTTTARISGPEDGDKPVFATISTLFTLVYNLEPPSPGPSIDDTVPILD